MCMQNVWNYLCKIYLNSFHMLPWYKPWYILHISHIKGLASVDLWKIFQKKCGWKGAKSIKYDNFGTIQICVHV